MGAAPALLGVGDRGMRHRLLVLAAPGRQRVADAVQRLADAGDVAVAEDRPDALDEALAVLGHLHAQPAHHRLRAVSRIVPLMPFPLFVFHATPPARSPALVPDRAEPGVAPAISATAASSATSPFIQARATSPKIVRPTAKPLTRSKPAAVSKLAAARPPARRGRAPRCRGCRRRAPRSPRWRSPRRRARSSARASTSRARRRRRRTAGSASRWCVVDGATLDGMISSRNSSRLRREASQSRFTVASCWPASRGVVRVAEAEHLDHVLAPIGSGCRSRCRARAPASAAASPAIRRAGRPRGRSPRRRGMPRPSRLSQRMP